VLYPSLEVEPYDTTIDDLKDRDSPVAPDAYQHTRYPWDEPLYETGLDFWTRRVHYGLASWLGMKSGFPEEESHCRRLIVLAGDRYVEPLREHDVFAPFPWHTSFPFQERDFNGIGEQMQWLVEEADRYEAMQPAASEQEPVDRWTPDLDPGIELAEDASGRQNVATGAATVISMDDLEEAGVRLALRELEREVRHIGYGLYLLRFSLLGMVLLLAYLVYRLDAINAVTAWM